MREIKFRAWDELSKIMINNEELIRRGFNPIKKWVLFKKLQYTGLKDKNGVEIYSGDLILLGKDSNGIIVGKVVYNEKDFGVPCYCIEEQDGSYQPFFAKGDNPKIWFEVIGNIYENSNLLGDE